MVGLLRIPISWPGCRPTPSSVPSAVLELLRFDGPNQFVRRIATEPMSLGDRVIEPGQVIYVGIGAANHDPARWGDDADAVPDRSRRRLAARAVRRRRSTTASGRTWPGSRPRWRSPRCSTRLTDLRLDGEVVWAGRTTLRSVAQVPLTYLPTEVAS